MFFTTIKNVAVTAAKKTMIFVNRHWKDIAFYGGMIAIPVGTILCCRATIKVYPDIEKAREDLNKDGITKKEIREIRWGLAKKVGKKFIVPVAVEGAGMLLFGSSRAMSNREIKMLTAAYMSVCGKNTLLREKLAERLGADETDKLLADLDAIETVNPDGTTNRVYEPPKEAYTIYDLYVDSTCTGVWASADMGITITNIESVIWNAEMLRDRWGLVTMADLADMLGHAREPSMFVDGFLHIRDAYDQIIVDWDKEYYLDPSHFGEPIHLKIMARCNAAYFKAQHEQTEATNKKLSAMIREG